MSIGSRIDLPLCEEEDNKTVIDTGTQSEPHHSSQSIRKSIRLKNYDYSLAGGYFITICCSKKQALLGKVIKEKIVLNDLGRIVEEEWQRTAVLRPNVFLDEYVVMPDHFHGIIIICHQDDNYVGRRGSIGSVVGAFKQSVSLRIRKEGFEGRVWQRGYYDHIIRNEHDYQLIKEYIHSNPSKLFWEE